MMKFNNDNNNHNTTSFSKFVNKCVCWNLINYTYPLNAQNLMCVSNNIWMIAVVIACVQMVYTEINICVIMSDSWSLTWNPQWIYIYIYILYCHNAESFCVKAIKRHNIPKMTTQLRCVSLSLKTTGYSWKTCWSEIKRLWISWRDAWLNQIYLCLHIFVVLRKCSQCFSLDSFIGWNFQNS